MSTVARSAKVDGRKADRSPTIQMDLVGHKTTYFPYRNPGLFTIPLSFAVGIVVSWLTPEPSATEQFAKLEQQIHFGELN